MDKAPNSTSQEGSSELGEIARASAAMDQPHAARLHDTIGQFPAWTDERSLSAFDLMPTQLSGKTNKFSTSLIKTLTMYAWFPKCPIRPTWRVRSAIIPPLRCLQRWSIRCCC